VTGPDQIQLGETTSFGVEFDQPGENDYVIDRVFDVDGPGGHVTLSESEAVTPTVAGTYTVNGHWTETCGDGVTPDRTVTGRPLTVVVKGLQAPTAFLLLQDGGRRLPGGRRAGAVAELRVECDAHPLPDAVQVIASSGGATAAVTRPRGCTAHRLGRSASRHGHRWSIGASDFDSGATVYSPVRRAARFELRSAGVAVASFDVRFSPRPKHREHVSLAASRCADGPCEVHRLGPTQPFPPLSG